jgi:hypothetical protein
VHHAAQKKIEKVERDTMPEIVLSVYVSGLYTVMVLCHVLSSWTACAQT